MFSIVTSSGSYQRDHICTLENDKYRYVDYEKYITTFENTLIDARNSFIKYYKESCEDNKSRKIEGGVLRRTGSGFFKIETTFHKHLMFELERITDLKSMWNILEYNEYNCEIYPVLFSVSPQQIVDNEIDKNNLRLKLKERIIKKMPWINTFLQAENIILENENEKSIFVFYNDNIAINLFEIKKTNNKLYTWKNEKPTTYIFRSPQNIEYVKITENDEYYINKIKVYRIDTLFTIVWPKSEKTNLEEMLYGNK